MAPKARRCPFTVRRGWKKYPHVHLKMPNSFNFWATLWRFGYFLFSTCWREIKYLVEIIKLFWKIASKSARWKFYSAKSHWWVFKQLFAWCKVSVWKCGLIFTYDFWEEFYSDIRRMLNCWRRFFPRTQFIHLDTCTTHTRIHECLHSTHTQTFDMAFYSIQVRFGSRNL